VLQVKHAFFQNANLASDKELKSAIARGRYMVKELIGVVQLKKYRTLKKRYSDSSEQPPTTAS